MENNLSPTWDDLRVLLALHQHRSFLAAGKALGVSTSTAARRIEMLEASLGRPLVHRSSSGTSVEPDALDLVALAEQLQHGLQAAKRDEGEALVSGTVRVSMGEGFVRPVSRVLCELRRKHPALHLEVVSETKLADLARRKADLGIRKVRSSSPVLIERAVGRLRFAFYASQSYVERRLRGGRLRLGDFERHDFLGYAGPMERVQGRWLATLGAERFPFRSNSDSALQEATEQGQGICLMAEAHARLATGLVKLDFEGSIPSVPVFLVFHKELRQMPKCRLVAGALELALRRGLA